MSVENACFVTSVRIELVDERSQEPDGSRVLRERGVYFADSLADQAVLRQEGAGFLRVSPCERRDQIPILTLHVNDEHDAKISPHRMRGLFVAHDRGGDQASSKLVYLAVFGPEEVLDRFPEAR